MSKIRKSARGKDCQVRIIGVCNFDPATTVAAHVNIAGLHGMGAKSSDILTVRACSNCHDAIDGRIKTGLSKTELKADILDGLLRTLAEYEKEGLICQK